VKWRRRTFGAAAAGRTAARPDMYVSIVSAGTGSKAGRKSPRTSRFGRPDLHSGQSWYTVQPAAPAGEQLRSTQETRIDASDESTDQQIPADRWQTLEARWKGILGLEAGIESIRTSVEGLRAELEAAFKKPLNVEEKLHALQADVAQWNKAKTRVHYVLPKAREFVHRATWALGLPERKNLEAIFKNQIEPRIPFPELDRVPEQLDGLQKDRQVLAAQGNTVGQECRSVLAEIQRTLNTLQRNAAENARRKREARRTKGKHL